MGLGNKMDYEYVYKIPWSVMLSLCTVITFVFAQLHIRIRLDKQNTREPSQYDHFRIAFKQFGHTEITALAFSVV